MTLWKSKGTLTFSEKREEAEQVWTRAAVEIGLPDISITSRRAQKVLRETLGSFRGFFEASKVVPAKSIHNNLYQSQAAASRFVVDAVVAPSFEQHTAQRSIEDMSRPVYLRIDVDEVLSRALKIESQQRHRHDFQSASMSENSIPI